MTGMKKIIGALPIAILAFASAQNMDLTAGEAAESRDQKPPLTEIITSNGVADWTNGVVRATGFGFPPKDAVNALHAKNMAQRAAHSVALRNLLEALKGVRVDSKTTVQNYVTTNDEIQVTVSGMIDRAKIVNERQHPDGSYEETVEVDLKGQLSAVLLPKPEAKPVKLNTSPSSGSIKTRGYSGLVVDARGLGAQPALAPKILDEDGHEAYSIAYVEAQDLINRGIAIYVADLSSAQVHPRVTNQPLIVKAMRVTGNQKSDLVISNADAQTIHGVPDHYRFLEKAQVLVVLDAKK